MATVARSGAYLQGSDLTLTALHRGVGLAYMGRLEKRATVPQKASVSVSLGRPASVPASTPPRSRCGMVAPMLSRAADRTRTAPSSLSGSTDRTRTDPGAERSREAPGRWLHRATSVCAVGLLRALLTLEISRLSSALSMHAVAHSRILEIAELSSHRVSRRPRPDSRRTGCPAGVASQRRTQGVL